MTSLPPAQPMTRRERRLLEEQAAAAQTVASVSTPEAGHTPPVSFAPPVAPPPVQAAPLTRRERRMMEQSQESPVSAEAPQPAVGFQAPVPPAPAVAAEPPAEPLPPVFAAPAPAAPPMTGPSPVSAPASGPVSTSPVETAPTSVSTTSRIVGDVSTATNSLILPTTPFVDMTSPLSSTGEVVVTGQITLPTRFAEQGSAPLLEATADNDEVLDAYVTGELAAMAKPVRASQAVSGKGDDTDIILVRRARWGMAAIVTVIVAGALALAAVGLLVLALTTDVLG